MKTPCTILLFWLKTVLRVLPVITIRPIFIQAEVMEISRFENKPPYIPASEMVYRFVGRKAFNGVYGSKVYVDMQAGQKPLTLLQMK